MRADITTLEFLPESFDAVIALYSIIHVPLDRQVGLLVSIGRWLVDGGRLLLTAGWDAWTGADTGWLGGDAPMWWSHADVETYRGWLDAAELRVDSEEYVAEGDGGHSLFFATRRPRP